MAKKKTPDQSGEIDYEKPVSFELSFSEMWALYDLIQDAERRKDPSAEKLGGVRGRLYSYIS